MDIVHVVLYEEGSTEKFFVVIMSCSWWVLNFCEVMLIVQPVEALYSKVKFVFEKIKMEQTRGYSFHVLFTKFKFSVAGVFPLDYTVVCTILAGSLTYLVYIVQFAVLEK
ncbi:hypothetical protein Zmor_022523 [Zophobas morio]|uniref:Gustatory receptor n=1 Tax=Zophobas morio TaxID=2755281 RepID=A0AA38HWN7_9CUCU|nr:hypothetical protein Zmor_022523 [Zophobas morio]